MWIFRDFSEAEQLHGIKIIRFSNELNFGNGRMLKRTLRDMIRTDPGELDAIIVDCQMIASIDSTAIRELTEVLKEAEDTVLIVLAAVPGKTRDTMERSKMLELIGFRTYFMSVHSAVQYVQLYLKEERNALPTIDEYYDDD
eukprot:TRINITY_DN3044_c0_g1_i1.p1 TRINITY_DN3044_c0_g1~~TRINITY_DN3044_c0_g1_i1.p1  ORF type:complete len:142 (-),score=16.85 TRINITY_DN3044_c0_g1_i1:253-678(-)